MELPLVESAENFTRLKNLFENKIPVYLKPGYAHVNNNTPIIKTMRETHGLITALDEMKVQISWEWQWPRPAAFNENFAVRSSDLFMHHVCPFLLTKDEWESSEEFKTLSSKEPKCVPGQIVYLSARYARTADEFFPKVGSQYEVHGKVIAVINNRNNTATRNVVRWFLRTNHYLFDDADLLSAAEYRDAKLNDTPQYTFIGDDPLISPDVIFIRDEKGYFKAIDDSAFVSDEFIELFSRIGQKSKK